MIPPFAVDVNDLQSVAAAALDSNGVLLRANAGFLRLLPARAGPVIGTRVARYFNQPGFAALVKLIDGHAPDGYRGALTIGDYAGVIRTLRGRVWRSDLGLQLLAEYDIGELERLNDAVLHLNEEAAIAQYALTSANVGLQQREVRIVEESLTDALTGVGNRRKLEQALALEIGRARRENTALSVIMADIDHFKRVNDEYGHSAGDQVLMQLGALLKSKTRAIDSIARFGGEEFVVLMPSANLADAMSRAEQIRTALAAEVIAPLPTPVTASFGVVELSGDEDGPALLHRVDVALYQAKDGGRNRVVGAPYAAGTDFPRAAAT